jgi:hypothetical protein
LTTARTFSSPVEAPGPTNDDARSSSPLISDPSVCEIQNVPSLPASTGASA